MTRRIRNMALSAAAAIAMTGVANAQHATAPEDTTSIVLVHGAFADGSGWRGVYDRLVAKGHRVAIVQNPLTSLEDDVDATKRVIERQPGHVILVGHSRSRMPRLCSQPLAPTAHHYPAEKAVA